MLLVPAIQGSKKAILLTLVSARAYPQRHFFMVSDFIPRWYGYGAKAGFSLFRPSLYSINEKVLFVPSTNAELGVSLCMDTHMNWTKMTKRQTIF